jgi:hypothetical protein
MDLRSCSQLPLQPPPVETLKDSDKGPSKGNQHQEHKHHNPPKRNEVEIRSARINVWNENVTKTFICNTGSLASWIWLHGCWSSNLCVPCFKGTDKFPMLASLPPPEWSMNMSHHMQVVGAHDSYLLQCYLVLRGMHHVRVWHQGAEIEEAEERGSGNMQRGAWDGVGTYGRWNWWAWSRFPLPLPSFAFSSLVP